MPALGRVSLSTKVVMARMLSYFETIAALVHSIGGRAAASRSKAANGDTFCEDKSGIWRSILV